MSTEIIEITNGGLAKGLLGTIHDTAHKIHDDVHNVFLPKEGPNNRGLYPAIDTVNHDETNEPVFTFAESTTTPQLKNTPATYTSSVKPDNVEQDADERPLIFMTSSTTETYKLQGTNGTTSNSTTHDKEGRENFKGACSTGRKLTEDGRCVVPF
ncbi:jg8509 [Pararge aegeria aegeria]|uniref:Jg8509 protein n=1 Tax=Pararge aegeria aegeria TaxID=348720 RepID=A0A8S4RAS8_9NEOP|nr:jg8509 [Pararge aegeria aegeria]